MTITYHTTSVFRACPRSEEEELSRLERHLKQAPSFPGSSFGLGVYGVLHFSDVDGVQTLLNPVSLKPRSP